MNYSIKSFIKGLISYTPAKYLLKKKGTGGTVSARYCYSVWLRHLILLYRSGLKEHPKIIAELGPGDSLGVGLAALITGADKYYAFDVIAHTDLKKNISIFEELLKLFENQTDIPDETEFPELKPTLDDYSFPKHIINFNINLLKSKIKQIYENLRGNSNDIIKYVVPWSTIKNFKEEKVDLIFSQAVMEHIIELESAYKIMFKWLKEGGYISHQIDFRAHETHKVWNGHWKYSNLIWKIIMHGRSYPINRQPYSVHIKNILNSGFEIRNSFIVNSKNGYKRTDFKEPFSSFENEDYLISSAHIIAKK
ncbi:MAG: methyltransferase domain-containing protein [Candidatus Pacearchaeota archaeon]